MNIEHHLQELLELVPPPSPVVDPGTLDDWDEISETIQQQIPLDLVLLSMRYGSGAFQDGGFGLCLHNVFRRVFPAIVEFNRNIFSSAKAAGQDVQEEVFELGSFEWGGEEQGDMCHVFWETHGHMDQWPVCISSETVPLQRFRMPLLEFLVSAFGNQLRVNRFPTRFSELMFVPSVK